MPLDSITIKALTSELSQGLVGTKIDKVQMPEKDVVLLTVRGKGCNKKLLLSANVNSSRVQFTDRSFENPQEPPMFCMLLRKHLIGSKIKAVYQPTFERMIVLDLDTFDELGIQKEKRIVVEMLGRHSNIILVGEDGLIIDCIRRADFGENALRRLLPGMIYKMPPKQEKNQFFTCTPEERKFLWENSDNDKIPYKRILDTFAEFSPLICKEMVYRCYGSIENMPLVLESFNETVSNDIFEPVIVTDNGEMKDFSFMKISQFGETSANLCFSSFSEMLDEFYAQKDKAESMHRKSKDLLRNVKTARARTLRKLQARMSEMEKTEEREIVRRNADLLKANIYRMKKGMHSIDCDDFYEEDNRRVTIIIDPLKTPQQNISVLYKEYNKLKTAREYLEHLIKENNTQLEYLDSVIDEVERAESEADLSDIRRELAETGLIRINKKKKKEKMKKQQPLLYISTDGNEILVGRNNIMNDELTTKQARRTDMWLHTQKIHGSHVIIRCEGLNPSDRTLYEAAVIAAYHSQSKNGGKVPVDYTMIKNIKKPSGAMPGYVIYNEYNTLYVDSDEKIIDNLRKN